MGKSVTKTGANTKIMNISRNKQSWSFVFVYDMFFWKHNSGTIIWYSVKMESLYFCIRMLLSFFYFFVVFWGMLLLVYACQSQSVLGQCEVRVHLGWGSDSNWSQNKCSINKNPFNTGICNKRVSISHKRTLTTKFRWGYMSTRTCLLCLRTRELSNKSPEL